MKPKTRLLVAAGGTGGHILPGVAVADAWRARVGAEAQVLFVGARGAMEERLVPRNGYNIFLISGSGGLNRVGLLKQLRTAVMLPWTLLQSIWVILKFRPHAVLGGGGYASGPVMLAAVLLARPLRITTAILEPNSVPGLTNRWLGSWVRWVFAAVPGSESAFGRVAAEVSGTPLRRSFERLPAAKCNPFCVFIFGGSQGARGINDLIIEALGDLGAQARTWTWIHQTGEADFERVSRAYQAAGLSARVERFIEDMSSAYREASVIVCRAGASTLAEIAMVGRAAVCVPLPTAADNHQEKNALAFERGGGILVHRQGTPIVGVLRSLYESPRRIHELEEQVTRFSRPHAARDIVSKILE